MKGVFRGYFYRGIVVVGILLLAGLISADIWLWQSDDGSGQAAGTSPGTEDRFVLPGLPARNTSGASSPESDVRQEETPEPSGGPSDASNIEDSVDLVVRDSEGNIKHQETVK